VLITYPTITQHLLLVVLSVRSVSSSRCGILAVGAVSTSWGSGSLVVARRIR
jgi:hypothetical protein